LFATHSNGRNHTYLVQKIKESSNFQEGMTMRQLSFWLTRQDGMDKILRLVKAFEIEQFADTIS
jgi:hypothetical protein